MFFPFGTFNRRTSVGLLHVVRYCIMNDNKAHNSVPVYNKFSDAPVCPRSSLFVTVINFPPRQIIVHQVSRPKNQQLVPKLAHLPHHVTFCFAILDLMHQPKFGWSLKQYPAG
jgi:hypothetical protein